ncbi:MAG TPA: flavodoxin domain-containing protein [Nitrososphaeraceae archaeon]|nr:flavodoxin domain-containing protein [Nitrososphaeraceae archaeon]
MEIQNQTRNGIIKAIIMFDTRYGNTEKIAKSLERGLNQTCIETVCVNTRDVTVDLLKQYDMICVGAPTQFMTASRPMKKFLGKLKSMNLFGKYGFAFDTKFDSRMSGSAAKFIEEKLKNLGLEIIAPRESAIVFGMNEKEGGAILKEGEETRFEQIGLRIGTRKTQAIRSP